MKEKIHVALSIVFIVFTLGCSSNRLYVSEQKAETEYFSSLPLENISMSRVRLLYEQKDYLLTEKALDILEKTGKSNAEYHLYRGFICKHQNRLNAAIAEYSSALDLIEKSSADSLYRMAYGGLAYAYYDLNDYHKSAEYHRKCSDYGGDISHERIAYLESFQERPYAIQDNCTDTKVKMLYRKGRQYVAIKINGNNETPFLIDTGANLTVISKRQAKKFHVKRISYNDKIKSWYGTFGVSTGVIDSLQIGEIQIFNVPVLIIDSIVARSALFISNLLSCYDIEGIIGLPLLKQFYVTFDYKNEYLELSRASKQIEPNQYHGNFYLNNNMLQLPVQINDVDTVNLLFDTGAPLKTISVSPTAFESMDDSGIGSSWGLKSCHFLIIPLIFPEKKIKNANLDIDRYRISNAVIRKEKRRYPPAMEGVIGNPFFEQFKTYIDFVNMKISLEPYE